MTTVNLVNPFWRKAFLYWRFTPLVAVGEPITSFALAELALATTPGGANLLASAVSVTAPGANAVASLYDGSDATASDIIANAARIASNTAYVQAEFAAPVTIGEVRLTRPNSGGADYVPSMWALAGSADGTNWTGFGVYSSGTYALSETKTFTIGGATQNGGRAGSRVWAMLREGGASSRWEIRELAFASGAGGGQLATGGTPFARGTSSGLGPVANAFDGNLSSGRWVTASGTPAALIGYYFASAPSPTHYRVTVDSANRPEVWGVYYLSNCADWVQADTRGSETGWTTGETREYEMAA